MVTLERIKNKLGIDLIDTSRDQEINDEITFAQNWVKGYCNNDAIDFSLVSKYDPVLYHLVLRELNEETSLRAGKTSENGGMSYSYEQDLPSELKRLLKRKIDFL